VTIDVAMEASAQPFIFAVMRKKEEKQWVKEYKDIVEFGSHPVHSSGVPNSCSVYSDSSEALRLLDSEVASAIRKCESFFQLLYYSDQSTITTKYTKVLRLVYKLPNKTEMAQLYPLMKASFLLVDYIASKPLSKATEQKNEKARSQQPTADSTKLAHEQRQELAQKKKQERKQKEEEKLEKLGPEAQRKAEEREYKKKLKQKQPKFKIVMG